MEIHTGYRKWIAAPQRRASPEVDFGVWWRSLRVPLSTWRVSWIQNTGELYACELGGDRYILLGKFNARQEVEERMAGWAESALILEIFFARFPLGWVVVTGGVAAEMEKNPDFAAFVQRSLARHAQGDWGDLCEEDMQENERALQEGGRLFSAYEGEGLSKIWIITEWDRSVTMILFPEEY